MSAKRIPYGISDYKTIISEGYAYVDKTMYIRSFEEAGVYNLFLRPRGFGKSLFASMLGYYYDIAEKDNFDLLFSNMDIGKNPTTEKSAYYILKFDFSGIKTDSPIILFETFSSIIHDAFRTFCSTYRFNMILQKGDPSTQLLHFFTEFQARCDGKIYVIIDEYDTFARKLLGEKQSVSKGRISGDGLIRAWYEVLKQESGTIVERIFITGVSPISLDSLTNGFNISQNLSMGRRFNEMMGFTRSEVEQLIRETISEEPPFDLMDTLTEYYNGYCFSEDGKERVFNSGMILYNLQHYQQKHNHPDTLFDQNAVRDDEKLEKLIRFQTPEQSLKILKDITYTGYTTALLTESYYIGQAFKPDHFKSLLFYHGLLTIKDTDLGAVRLQIPNKAITGLYFDFLMQMITEKTQYLPPLDLIEQAMNQLAYENSCEKLTALVEDLLYRLSNRDSIGFSEKEIKLAMTAYANMSNLYFIKSKYEVKAGQYIDLVFFPRGNDSDHDILLFEIKYIKKDDVSKKAIAEKCSNAVEQLKKYRSAKEFSERKVTAWAIVFAWRKCVERVRVSP